MSNSIPAVGLDGFHLPQRNPKPEGDHVPRNQCRTHEGGDAKDQHLRPVGVRRCKSNGGSELMVNPVDVLIPPFAMEEPVDPIITIVLNQEVHQKL